MASVLVIDDDRQFRQFMTQALERKGYEVFEAEDGLAGTKSVTANKPDLVIVDILMPEKDGLEVIREISHDRPESKIIAISGGGAQLQVDFLPAAKKLGASATLHKPIEPEDLLKCVGEMLAS